MKVKTKPRAGHTLMPPPPPPSVPTTNSASTPAPNSTPTPTPTPGPAPPTDPAIALLIPPAHLDVKTRVENVFLVDQSHKLGPINMAPVVAYIDHHALRKFILCPTHAHFPNSGHMSKTLVAAIATLHSFESNPFRRQLQRSYPPATISDLLDRLMTDDPGSGSASGSGSGSASGSDKSVLHDVWDFLHLYEHLNGTYRFGADWDEIWANAPASTPPSAWDVRAGLTRIKTVLDTAFVSILQHVPNGFLRRTYRDMRAALPTPFGELHVPIWELEYLRIDNDGDRAGPGPGGGSTSCSDGLAFRWE